MKIIGVIVEYNPLHNGHIYHINKIKEITNADLIIAVMSSSFTMRGDLSIYDKFTKTNHALQNNIDLVIELPLVYCIQRADLFAKNAVDLLNNIGVNEIWIGSEQNNTEIYKKYYNQYNEESINNDDGISYKAATMDIMPMDSNDILGFGYYKAIKDNSYNIELHTIKRESSKYLDINPTDSHIASALAIRNNLDLINNYCPSYVYKDIDKLLDENRLFEFLKYRILSSTNKELKNIFFVDEGLENKLYEVYQHKTLDSFINSLVSKRYTKTRIKRMLIYILLSISKEEINSFQMDKIPYSRVLGYNNKGKEYLNRIKKNLVIYTNIKNGLHRSLDIELRTSKILDMIYGLNLFELEQKGPQTK